MIVENLIECFKNARFTLKEAYMANPDVNKESVRARIYENLGIAFERVGRGIYTTLDNSCLLIEGNGRNLSALADESIDCIVTDHPWDDKKATKGGSRNFANYDTFQYVQEDFDEKARVLKNGSFLCEIIPAESATNYEYLYKIKEMAKKAGFEYYAKVSWKKGTFVSNTGRKAKNTEDILFFTKGKARALRPDKQRGLDENGNPTRFMSGANGMLPTCFDVQAVPKKDVIAQSEKPVALYEQILDYISKPNEIVLDQFAGSGALGEAALNKGRRAILIELAKEKVEKIACRLKMNKIKEAYTC
ncbi:DNA-methyltransferase [Lachnospira multipara]|uniref:Methyltransferase n=1 Tax=Lachnospira multipara TaxID=28051 RepID=A0A1H5VTT5_9FIRM|nr:site-specific DNA-methyltransferase [Lachnospira multipara]SEF90654.1 site-specific DNA-methyltransferase (adenine-specific) [Lachnospira multipara]